MLNLPSETSGDISARWSQQKLPLSDALNHIVELIGTHLHTNRLNSTHFCNKILPANAKAKTMAHLITSFSVLLAFGGVLIAGLGGFSTEGFSLAVIVVVTGMLGSLFVIDGFRPNSLSMLRRGSARQWREKLKKYAVPMSIGVGLALLLITVFQGSESGAKDPPLSTLGKTPRATSTSPLATPMVEPALLASSAKAATAPGSNVSIAMGEVLMAVETWRSAWEARDIERYLAAYAQDFQPAHGLSLEEWRQQREERVVRARNLQITLDEQDIAVDGDRAVVSFRQQYRAAGRQDTVRKQLNLSHTDAGWRIVAEAAQ